MFHLNEFKITCETLLQHAALRPEVRQKKSKHPCCQDLRLELSYRRRQNSVSLDL